MTEDKQPDFGADILAARNEAYSYYNTNTEAISTAALRSIEAGQVLLQKQLTNNQNNTQKPLRVLFMLADSSLWDVYSPIYLAMAASELFDPFVIAFDRLDIEADKNKTDVLEFFKKSDIRGEFIDKPDNGLYPALSDFSPDMVFYTLGTIAYPEAYRIEFVSKFCLTLYLPYGFLMVNELEYQFGQSFHHAAWKIFASTKREEAEYLAHSKRLTPNTALVGYTKFDLYKSDTPKKPDRQLIIWAPHWTIGIIYPALNLGCFSEICNDMMALMQTHSDIDFLFRPHPNLRYACQQTTFMSNDIYDQYLETLQKMPNVTVELSGNNIEQFRKSSAMITDSVSFLAEYLPSDKPLLFLERKDRAKFTDTGEQIINSHYRGCNINDIENFIQANVTKGNDPKKLLRKKAIKSELNIDKQAASQKIIEHICSSLNLSKDEQ